MRGVTQLQDVVYIVCAAFSTIWRFSATTHQRLTNINIKHLTSAWDIVACEQTLQVYIADYPKCVWRMSADGDDITLWWLKSSSDTFIPRTLSIASAHLLVTSLAANQLMQLDSNGNELTRIQLPDYMEPHHAVQSPTETIIVSHNNTQLGQYQISEVNTAGEVLRQFSGSRISSLGETLHVAVDSHGNIFLADDENRCILLLDAQLTLRRCIVEEHQLNYKGPWRLCYREPTGQLLIGLFNSVVVFDVLHR